jgi:chromosome segregation ATPase
MRPCIGTPGALSARVVFFVDSSERFVMPSAASRFVTREEFSLVKETLERLIVRVEVLTQDLHALSKQVDARFERVDARFAQQDERFKGIDERFKGIDERFDAIDARFERIEERLALHDVRFDHLEARLEALERHVDTGFAELRQLIETNHAAIVSALNQLLSRR